MELTVGRLKELLKGMDDGTPVVKMDNNFELQGAYTKATERDVIIQSFRKERQTFVDAFDGTVFKQEVYVVDNTKEGKPMLRI